MAFILLENSRIEPRGGIMLNLILLLAHLDGNELHNALNLNEPALRDLLKGVYADIA